MQKETPWLFEIVQIAQRMQQVHQLLFFQLKGFHFLFLLLVPSMPRVQPDSFQSHLLPTDVLKAFYTGCPLKSAKHSTQDKATLRTWPGQMDGW